MIWYNDFKVVNGEKKYTIVDDKGVEIAEFNTKQIPINVVIAHNEMVYEAIKYGKCK